MRLIMGILGAAVLYGWGASSTFHTLEDKCENLGFFERRDRDWQSICSSRITRMHMALVWPNEFLHSE